MDSIDDGNDEGLLRGLGKGPNVAIVVVDGNWDTTGDKRLLPKMGALFIADDVNDEDEGEGEEHILSP